MPLLSPPPGALALLLLAAVLCAFPSDVESHGSMVMPAPRNAIDSQLPAWSGGKHPMTGSIQPYNCRCANGTDECNSGQACFWFSQGCSIGCQSCDGNGTRIPGWDHCPELPKPKEQLLSKYRTANQGAAEGTVADVFRFNPWRAPGKAPVSDPCGVAGGRVGQTADAFNAAEFNDTVFARQGDLGSAVLKQRPSGTVWTRGAEAAVRFQLTANHGGGYQYRLCPAGKPLTEACFQEMPLAFAHPTKQMLRFAEPERDRWINATMVTEGGGIGWMRNPKPATFDGCDRVVLPGQPHCDYGCPGCGPPNYPDDAACPLASCSPHYPGTPAKVGNVPTIFPDQTAEVHTYVVEDTLKVPAGVTAGEYVVGFRWDCEQTTQIWQQCADITIA